MNFMQQIYTKIENRNGNPGCCKKSD